MKEYDATEQVYKSGYEQGVKDLAAKVKEACFCDIYHKEILRMIVDDIAKEIVAERRKIAKV